MKSMLHSIEEKSVVGFVNIQLNKNISKIPFASFASQGIRYALENKEQEKLLDAIIPRVRDYISNNKQEIYNRVVEKQPLLGLIGGKSVTNQLIGGLQTFLLELEANKQHPIRVEVDKNILEWSKKITTDSIWQNKFTAIILDYMNPEITQKYILEVWNYFLINIESQWEEESRLDLYLQDGLQGFVKDFKSNLALQAKWNTWIQYSLYKMILKNTKELGKLIEETVGNWDGKELSNKLELEVGKDLQFIRVNGTLVGGLVGFIIYVLANILM